MPRKKRKKTPFAANLISLMEEKAIGVREAAKIAGVSPSTVSEWRNGSHPDDYIAVKKLAKTLGTTLSFLLTGEDDNKVEVPAISEVFTDGGDLFNGFAEIRIKRLIPRDSKKRE